MDYGENPHVEMWKEIVFFFSFIYFKSSKKKISHAKPNFSQATTHCAHFLLGGLESKTNLKFTRMTRMPFCTIFSSTSSCSLTGPMVATILVNGAVGCWLQGRALVVAQVAVKRVEVSTRANPMRHGWTAIVGTVRETASRTARCMSGEERCEAAAKWNIRSYTQAQSFVRLLLARPVHAIFTQRSKTKQNSRQKSLEAQNSQALEAIGKHRVDPSWNR
jgi:hypothetical protein